MLVGGGGIVCMEAAEVGPADGMTGNDGCGFVENCIRGSSTGGTKSMPDSIIGVIVVGDGI